jgi:phospholipid/cholesterol/gamma-HCH transport system permease protein
MVEKLVSTLIFKRVNDGLLTLGDMTLLFWETVQALFRRRLSFGDLLYQLYFIGLKSQSVVLITGAFTGMVLAAQTYLQFHKVRMDTATMAVVSVSMLSQLGPVLTGLMVAGRVGASIAAELGTMKVTEQIDALRTLATHPVDYLVLPRVVAATIALPVLTSEAIAIGIGSGYLVTTGLLKVDPTYTWANMLKYTVPNHLNAGLSKAVFFGVIISLIACYKGTHCGEGAEGVGRATTEAVVTASISILISNFFLTLFLGQVFAP